MIINLKGAFWGNKFNKYTQNSNTMPSKLEEDEFLLDEGVSEDTVPFDQLNYNQIQCSENPDIKEENKM